MTATPPSAPDQLDYLSFVDFAVDKATRELGSVDATAMRLVLTLHRVTSALVYDLESSVHRPRGWSWPGFRVLFVLWLAGPLEAKQVAELSGMSRAAVSALVGTLERGGLIVKARADYDRRAVQLDLTDEGRAAIVGAFAAHNQREQAWAGALTGSEQLDLIRLLEKLTHGADDVASRKRF
jgi:DNA-binding MarR family transcriptional regulator